MKRIWGTAWVTAIAVGLIAISAVSTTQAENVDYEALAQNLVKQCADIQEGDLVLIYGGVRDFELLENIAVNVRKLGAFPLLTAGSDRLAKRMYDDVSPKHDGQEPRFYRHLAKIIDARIAVDSSENLGVLEHVPADRLVASYEAAGPIEDIMLERKVKQVSLGNGLYPIPDRANLYGVTVAQLAQTFWDGVNVDYAALRATGDFLKGSLAGGKEIHLTHPNGTDLRVGIAGRPVFVSDGTISAEDVAAGGVACQVWLPAGEIFVSPIPGTAEGKVVVDHQYHEGKVIEDMTLIFKAGKLISMTAKSGLEPLQEMYDASGPGKDEFAVVDIGMNPRVKIIPGSRMVAWMATGMVTVGFGNNLWAGGENNANFSLYSYLPGSTLRVDDTELVRDGKLKKMK